MFNIGFKSHFVRLFFSVSIAMLAGACTSVDADSPGYAAHPVDATAAVPAADTPDDVPAQRGWLFPGPRGVAPCPMPGIMDCAAPTSSTAINGGI
jgi:hypothetical protein